MTDPCILEICILYGCSVPILLRPESKKSGAMYHKLIGECYLHTMMDGQAIDALEREEIPTEQFELQ